MGPAQPAFMKPGEDQNEVLLREALQRPRGLEREAFLEGACLGNPQRRALLEALLQAEESPDPWLESPAPAPDDATPLVSPPEGPGTMIGRYKLLEKVGEGGFGAVYVAEQREPVKRRVALKVIKLGMDTRQVVARFEAERQALALMDHRNWVLSVAFRSAVASSRDTVGVYRTTYVNPRPELQVMHIDFVSRMTQSAPFLIALTVE